MAKRKTHSRSSKGEKNLPQGAFSKPVFSWFSPQYLRFNRGVVWYMLAGLINFALLGYAIWAEIWTMALVFVLLPIAFLVEQRNKPKVVEVIISEYGVKFGVFRVAYSDIKSFWILHDPPYVDELHILTNQKMHPEITIPLVGTDPALVRQYLVTQVPEWEGKKQSFLENLTRFLRLH